MAPPTPYVATSPVNIELFIVSVPPLLSIGSAVQDSRIASHGDAAQSEVARIHDGAAARRLDHR